MDGYAAQGGGLRSSGSGVSGATGAPSGAVSVCARFCPPQFDRAGQAMKALILSNCGDATIVSGPPWSVTSPPERIRGSPQLTNEGCAKVRTNQQGGSAAVLPGSYTV